MDSIRVHGRVKMLNFACIKIDFHKPLGSGSFSKVYQGTYRGKECAIKLIYTVDLTTDVIRRVAAEASILSSIRHPNIVHIYGVSVLPPSVCLILEVCSFGSLSDVIRGYGFDWSTASRAPLSLSYADVLYLALGCARGLSAVHSYDRYLCHRDVKSFNFLVDHQLNVKIADLELGLRDSALAAPRRRRRPQSKRSARSGATGWHSVFSSLSSSSSARSSRSNTRSHVAHSSDSLLQQPTLHPHDQPLLSSPRTGQADDDEDEDEEDTAADDDGSMMSLQSGDYSQSSTSSLDDASRNRQYSSTNGNNANKKRQGRSGGGKSGSGDNKPHVGEGNEVPVDELLANWMAPEVMRDKRFQQPSDVYALGTVMWEILSKQLPFENDSQREIRRKVLEGFQHPIPEEAQETPLAYIIRQCWLPDPAQRPRAKEVVRYLEKILREDVFHSLVPDHEVVYRPDFTTMLNYYEACYRKATVSDVQSQLRVHVPSRAGRRSGQEQGFWRTAGRILAEWVDWASNPFKAREYDRHSQQGLPLLNPTANHLEEADDENFAFTLPAYSVRGSELSTSQTALTMAQDLRHSMRKRQTQQQQQQQQQTKPTAKTSSSSAAAAAAEVEDVSDDEDKGGERKTSRSRSAADRANNYDANDVDDEDDEDWMDSSSSEAPSSRDSSHDGYISSLARVAMPMPPAAVEAVRMVRKEAYWKALESSGEPWVVLTPRAPYIVVHATKQWYDSFSIVSATSATAFHTADAPMLSLLALLTPEIEAMSAQCFSANTYIQLAGAQGFRKMRSASAKEVLRALQRQEEYHGVLALHLPHVQELASRGGTGSGSSLSAGLLSLTSSSRSYSTHPGGSSVTVDTTGRLRGTNTMFSVHIYPVKYNEAAVWQVRDSFEHHAPEPPASSSTAPAAADAVAAGDVASPPPALHQVGTPVNIASRHANLLKSNSTNNATTTAAGGTPSTPTTTQRPSFLQRRFQHGPYGTAPTPSTETAESAAQAPIYYAVMFHELREQAEAFTNPPPPSHHQHHHNHQHRHSVGHTLSTSAADTMMRVRSRMISRGDEDHGALLATLQQEEDEEEALLYEQEQLHMPSVASVLHVDNTPAAAATFQQQQHQQQQQRNLMDVTDSRTSGDSFTQL